MPPSSLPSNQRGTSDSPSSGEEKKKSSSPSSWFASWFENDNTHFKDQIHDQLNDFEAYQQRYERHNPFFIPRRSKPSKDDEASTSFNAAGATTRTADGTGTSLQREMEEFFESAGLGGMADLNRSWMSSSASSSSSSVSSISRIANGHSYQVMRHENDKGVQIDVQFPLQTNMEREPHINHVHVAVLEQDQYDPSSSCVVQWRHDESKIRDHVRLGKDIDCSQLSASISMSQNRLTMKAPTIVSASSTKDTIHLPPRRIPVTDRPDSHDDD